METSLNGNKEKQEAEYIKEIIDTMLVTDNIKELNILVDKVKRHSDILFLNRCKSVQDRKEEIKIEVVECSEKHVENNVPEKSHNILTLVYCIIGAFLCVVSMTLGWHLLGNGDVLTRLGGILLGVGCLAMVAVITALICQIVRIFI